MSDLVVVVPAHQEEDHIATTVRDVRRALAHASRAGLVRRYTIEVVAHRCRDETAERAAAALARGRWGHVTRDEVSTTVGQVRDRGARLGLARLALHGTGPQATWVLSTDADTRLPANWVVDILRSARSRRAVAVVGLAALHGWRAGPQAQSAYAALIAAKMSATSGLDQHHHVYGANLAIRADAYLAVGGFPTVPVGEDQAIVDALSSAGLPVLRTRHITVRTSGRVLGRAAGGLASRLAALETGPATPAAVTSQVDG